MLFALHYCFAVQTDALNRMTRGRFFLKLLVCALASVAWFAAAQHCALGTISYLVAEASSHGCCHESHAMPVGQKSECCAALAAPLPHTVDSAHAPLLLAVLSVWQELLLLPAPVSGDVQPGWYQDAGPPSSERQLLLSRLNAAHAPPHEVA